MAALWPPAAIVAPASSTPGASRLSSWLPRNRTILPIFHLSSTSTLVKMQPGKMRAQNGAGNQPARPDPNKDEELKKIMEKIKEICERPPDMPFRKELVKMDELDWIKMVRRDSSFLHLDARSSSMCVIMVAKAALELASEVMVSAGLRVGMPEEFSVETVKQTLLIYVSSLISIVDEVYERKATKKTIVSLLGALEGVAAISHILLQDALVNLNNNRDSSSHYSPDCDVDRDRHKFEQKLTNLKHDFMTAPPYLAYRILKPTLLAAKWLTETFVFTMTQWRKMVISQVQVAGGAPGDGESDSMDTGSHSV